MTLARSVLCGASAIRRMVRGNLVLLLLLALPAGAQEKYGYTRADADFLGRFTFLFSAGAELAQDEGDFSDVSLHLRLAGDTVFRSRSADIDASFRYAFREHAELGFSSLPAACKGRRGSSREACQTALEEAQLREIAARRHVPAEGICRYVGRDRGKASIGKISKELRKPARLMLQDLRLGSPPKQPSPAEPSPAAEGASEAEGSRELEDGLRIRNGLWRGVANEAMNELVLAMVQEGVLTCAPRPGTFGPDRAAALGVPLPDLDALPADHRKVALAEWKTAASAALARDAVRRLGATYFERHVTRSQLWDWRNLHTRVRFQLGSIPTEAEIASQDDFVAAEKGLTSELSVDWMPVRLEAYGGSLRMGPSATGGFQTVDTPSDPDTRPNLDTVNNFWGVGFRMAEGYTETLEVINPPANRYVAFYYGGYEAFGDDRFTIDAQLQPRGGGPFVGFRSVLGDGPDDVRITAGVAMSLETLGRFVNEALNVQALFGGAVAE